MTCYSNDKVSELFEQAQIGKYEDLIPIKGNCDFAFGCDEKKTLNTSNISLNECLNKVFRTHKSNSTVVFNNQRDWVDLYPNIRKECVIKNNEKVVEKHYIINTFEDLGGFPRFNVNATLCGLQLNDLPLNKTEINNNFEDYLQNKCDTLFIQFQNPHNETMSTVAVYGINPLILQPWTEQKLESYRSLHFYARELDKCTQPYLDTSYTCKDNFPSEIGRFRCQTTSYRPLSCSCNLIDNLSNAYPDINFFYLNEQGCKKNCNLPGTNFQCNQEVMGGFISTFFPMGNQIATALTSLESIRLITGSCCSSLDREMLLSKHTYCNQVFPLHVLNPSLTSFNAENLQLTFTNIPKSIINRTTTIQNTNIFPSQTLVHSYYIPNIHTSFVPKIIPFQNQTPAIQIPNITTTTLQNIVLSPTLTSTYLSQNFIQETPTPIIEQETIANTIDTKTLTIIVVISITLITITLLSTIIGIIFYFIKKGNTIKEVENSNHQNTFATFSNDT